MKTLLSLVSFFAVVLVAQAADTQDTQYSRTISHTLAQLRECVSEAYLVLPGEEPEKPRPLIGGCSVGYGGGPGQFFLLIHYLRSFANADDIQNMLSDRSPAVRVMAAYLVLARNSRFKDISVSRLSNDLELVDVAPGGCIVEAVSVRDLVAKFRANPDYLGEQWYFRMMADTYKQENGG